MDNCKDCFHHRPTSSRGTPPICHYALDTGKLRNSSPESCDKHTVEAVKKFDSWDAISEGTWRKRVFEEGLQ